MDEKNINESVLDPVQKYRCDAMFNPNDTSDQPVILYQTKQFIFSILDKFKQEVGLENMEYTEAFVVGSSLGFQYRDDCDIDVDVRVNLSRNELKGKFHCIPKNVLLPGTAHPVNIFLLTADDPEYDFDNNAENAYDLLTDTWIKQGTLANADNIPFEYVAGVSEFIMDGIALELNRAERDLYDLDKYIRLDPNKVAISESERKAAISQKISELIIDKDALKLAHTLMFRLDRDGFDDKPISMSIKYKADSKHYSMNNLIYKYIDRYGYYEKIEEMSKSIDEAISVGKNALKIVAENSPETENMAQAQQEVIGQMNATELPEKNKLTESYTDDELKQILVENGLEDSDVNVMRLKIHPYAIVDSEDPLTDSILTETFRTNFLPNVHIHRSKEQKKQDLVKSTEKKLNKIVYKSSGKVNTAIRTGLGFLFTGAIGAMISNDINGYRNYNKDDIEAELYDKIEYDSHCQKILSDIKQEVEAEKPDTEKLKKLKVEFAKAVKTLRQEIKKADSSTKSVIGHDDSHIFNNPNPDGLVYDYNSSAVKKNIKLTEDSDNDN